MSQMSSIKKTNEYIKVYRRGKRLKNPWFDLIYKENGGSDDRLGISVSKKVGNSVVRHHLTRLVRESYRLHEEMFNSGLDIVVVARVNAKQASYHEIEKAMLHLANLHNILNKEKKMESF